MKERPPAGKCKAKCEVKRSSESSVSIDLSDRFNHKLELYVRSTDVFEGLFHCVRVSERRYNEPGKKTWKDARYFSDPESKCQLVTRSPTVFPPCQTANDFR